MPLVTESECIQITLSILANRRKKLSSWKGKTSIFFTFPNFNLDLPHSIPPNAPCFNSDDNWEFITRNCLFDITIVGTDLTSNSLKIICHKSWPGTSHGCVNFSSSKSGIIKYVNLQESCSNSQIVLSTTKTTFPYSKFSAYYRDPGIFMWNHLMCTTRGLHSLGLTSCEEALLGPGQSSGGSSWNKVNEKLKKLCRPNKDTQNRLQIISYGGPFH